MLYSTDPHRRAQHNTMQKPRLSISNQPRPSNPDRPCAEHEARQIEEQRSARSSVSLSVPLMQVPYAQA